MQIKFIGSGVRGFGRITDYAIRWSRMVTKEAQRRARILIFWKKYGITATKEAFHVGRSTLFDWQAKQKKGQGRIESLNPLSRAPKTVRRREWSPTVILEIKRLRSEHPNLGPEKIAVLLVPFGKEHYLSVPRARTVARIIGDASDKMRRTPEKVRHNGDIVPRKREKRLIKPKHFHALYPGHCVALDTIERHINGARRYLITFTDTFSHFSFAWATTSHASKAAQEIFSLASLLFPYKMEHILTDNGSEFMKHFDEELRSLHKTHWHTYPRTPKMNAHCERFNRTIQEEFVDYHIQDLLTPSRFNKKLIQWLFWYNDIRPHHSLNLKSPVQFLMEKHPTESSMWWQRTCR